MTAKLAFVSTLLFFLSFPLASVSLCFDNSFSLPPLLLPPSLLYFFSSSVSSSFFLSVHQFTDRCIGQLVTRIHDASSPFPCNCDCTSIAPEKREKKEPANIKCTERQRRRLFFLTLTHLSSSNIHH